MSTYILKNETVTGESTLANFQGGVDVDVFEFGIAMNTTTPGQAGGAQRSSGVLQILPFSIAYRNNSSTIKFIQALQQGSSINDVVISQLKTVGGTPTPFAKWTLHKTVVQAVGTLPPDHPFYSATQTVYDPLAPLVQVSLICSNFDAEYTKYNDNNTADGTFKVTAVGSAASSR
ncbi:type VI secretion system tube protein Hcp [Caballeronia zhejiangensis]|uniref:type VI secretion system tube protein Hcp n=1 Tax=Caballeronia zhejiangensis TaxID=871203 RepID=UPI00158CA9F9|nr:type VI secretion system tube protein Hcp [Caballeronia zhejiangensis]